MKGYIRVSVILSLVFLLLSCGISVPFMWDSSKVSITRDGTSSNPEHVITVKDSGYTEEAGYDFAVMYLYTLTDRDKTSTYSYWTNFESVSKMDSHNSKKYKQSEADIGRKPGEEKSEYPVFMFSAKDSGRYSNSTPDYLFNTANAGFEPGKPVTFSYAWDTDGYIVVTCTREGHEPIRQKLGRAGGQSFRNESFKAEDAEFKGEKNPTAWEIGKDYTVSIMPCIYAYSKNHPNQKFYINTNAAAILDTSDIRMPDAEKPEAPETAPSVPEV